MLRTALRHAPARRTASIAGAVLAGVAVLCASADPARAQSCTKDADCPEGMGCDIGPTTGTLPCPSDGECPEPEPAPPPPEGRCEPQTVACADDGDCPTGLSCVEQSGGDSAGACSIGSDGGVQCEDAPEPEPTTRACGFSLAPCEQDTDCSQEGFACIVGKDSSKCGIEPCSADGECPEPPEEDCMTEELRVCFPARVDCVDDSECADGWSCYALPEDARQDLAAYADATEVCMPEGLVLAFEKQIELAESDSGGGDGAASGGAADDEAAAPGSGNDDKGVARADEDAMRANSDSGCSVTDVSRSGPSGGTLGLLLGSVLALAWRRRAAAASMIHSWSGVSRRRLGSLLALALLFAAESSARAQCVEDADCGPGLVCELQEPPTADCPPGQSCPQPPDPVVEGVCVGAPCTEDADCAHGFGCELDGGGQASRACPRDGECPEPEPLPEPEGRCEPQPIECEDDADCPTGLTCVEQDGGDSSTVACTSSPDGNEECVEVPDPEPEPATRACGFTLQECTEDSDCSQAGYACLVSESKTTDCSVSQPACPSGSECPAPTEPECSETSERLRFCFPERVDCTDDSDCADGWTCFTLPDDAAASPPEGYEGATDVCMPEGIALAINEEIELADVDADDAGGARSPAEGGGEATADDSDSDAPGGGNGKTAASGDDGDSGCSVSAMSGPGARGAALWLALGSALVLARRRRARGIAA